MQNDVSRAHHNPRPEGLATITCNGFPVVRVGAQSACRLRAMRIGLWSLVYWLTSLVRTDATQRTFVESPVPLITKELFVADKVTSHAVTSLANAVLSGVPTMLVVPET